MKQLRHRIAFHAIEQSSQRQVSCPNFSTVLHLADFGMQFSKSRFLALISYLLKVRTEQANYSDD